MAAVTGHLESTDPIDETPMVCEAPAELGAQHPDDLVCFPEAALSHERLLQFLWGRRIAEDALVGRHFALAERRSTDPDMPGELFLEIDPPIAVETNPWWHIGGKAGLSSAPIFGSTEKMVCPSFDLPAGYLTTGGSCPAAGMCQSTTPLADRVRLAKSAASSGVILSPSGARGAMTDEPALLETVCTSCYASGARFREASIQFQMSARYLWTRYMFDTGRANEWIDSIVAALSRVEIGGERPIDPRTGEPVIPVRLHSSGDFFSPEYATAWVAVCNQFPQVLFWAPTRTWAYTGWLDRWPALLKACRYRNLIVRPSALHFGDMAPSMSAHPWWGEYPFNASGTTSIGKAGLLRDLAPIEAEGANYGRWDERYDWGCQAYHRENALEAPNCRAARGPDGLIGCRACWVDPWLRVNFSQH